MAGLIQITQKEGEKAAHNTWSDFEWGRQNRDWLYEHYGAGVVLVYGKQVTGSGLTLEAAELDAESRYQGTEAIRPVILFIPKPGRRIATMRAVEKAADVHDSN